MALGIRAAEKNRNVLAAISLGIAGLVRETSVLAGAGLLRSNQGRRGWTRSSALVLACLTPAFLWAIVLRVHYGHSGGMRNIAPSFSAFAGKIREIETEWHDHGFASVEDEVFVVVSLAAQVAFLAIRPNPRVVWWRVGAPFALLCTFLGPAVWEGTPSAATRAVLPMTLAFNVLVPRTGAGLILLAAGNLTLLSTPALVREGQSETVALTRNVSVDYGSGWYSQERLGRHSWRWNKGDAILTIHNATGHAVTMSFDFGLRTVLDRSATIATANTRQTVLIFAQKMTPVHLGPFVVPPGDASVILTATGPAWSEPGTDGRKLVVALYDLGGSVL